MPTPFEPAPERFAATLREMLGVPPWCIDTVEIDGDMVEMRGWALAPAGDHAALTFALDGRDFDAIDFPLARADIERIFWFHPGASAAAFRCRTAVPDAAVRRGYATLQCLRRDRREPLRAEYDYFLPVSADEPPVPDEARRVRVAGNPNAGVFRLEGFTTLMKLERALAAVGRTFRDADSVLDWGCGCGRVARYLPRFTDARITGVDIDADNLVWCRRELRFGEFRRVPLRPPTDLPAATFDLVIGISVCTHLREPEQRAWLAELARVTRPGAVLLLTVLGDANVTWSRFSPPLLEQWRTSGFLAVDGNVDLKGHIDEEGYYVNTYMTRAHVERSWSRFFVIRGIVPGLIGNNQDLVVLQRPA
jgi:SAM-dependent methyltransferase